MSCSQKRKSPFWQYFEEPIRTSESIARAKLRHNQKPFPIMYKLARRYLAAPASSVYSDRIFSEAGNIYESKRNRLLPDRAENLVFLHNLQKLNYSY